MRLALLSDIHANREAFDACLADAALRRVDRFAFLGDYVGYGADPAYAVDRVRRFAEEGAVVLKGNHDEAVAGPTDGFNPVAREAVEWTRGRLDAAEARFLRDLPLTHEEDDRLLVHANAWAPGEWDYVFDAPAAGRSLAATRRRVTFCGHIHVPALYALAPGQGVSSFPPVSGAAMDLYSHRQWLAVVGSVGQPRDGRPDACYAILDEASSTLTIHRVPYDVEAAAAKIRRAGLPEALAVRLRLGR